MRIYFDVCCLNRPFDDQSQQRIRLETEAVTFIMQYIQQKSWCWLGSSAVLAEVKQTPDPARRQAMLSLVGQMTEQVPLDNTILGRVAQLQKVGFSPFDAAHLAFAEAGRCDLFLTTDDQLLKISQPLIEPLPFRLENPLRWLQEIWT